MSKTNTLDLASISAKAACNKGFELELTHPVSFEPLGVFISVVGRESDAFQGHVRKRANAKMREQFQAQRNGRANEVPTVEQIEAEAIDLLVACTTGWRTGDVPVIEWAGEKLDFTDGNVRRIYGETWIRAQVDEAIGDLGNFMPD